MQAALVLVAFLSPICPQEPAKAAGPPTVEQALDVGQKLLVALQEQYAPDRRMRRMRDEDIPAWQEKERERLAKLRKANGPGTEWPYEGVYRVRGLVPPGYRVGGSAIACSALVQTPGFGGDEKRQAAVQRATRFMLDELRSNELLGPGPKRGYDVRGWAHTYALDFFLLAERKKLLAKADAARVKKMIPHLLHCLAKNETRDGGWNYASNSISPFMTGSTLIALFHARKQGYDVDAAMVDRALAGLAKARTKLGAYVYSGILREGRRRSSRTAMPGACARAAIAELCLFHAGRSDAKKVRVAVDAFFEHWDELLKRKSQQGTHKGPYGIAPYYFMYGHTYAALAIEALPEQDRPKLRQKMRATLWKTREPDGGWNDRVFPRSKSYSTAMAMLALLAPQVDAVPTWEATPNTMTKVKAKTKTKK